MAVKPIMLQREGIFEVKLGGEGLCDIVCTDRKVDLRNQANHGSYFHRLIFNPAESWENYYMKHEEVVMMFYQTALEYAEDHGADYVILMQPHETKVPHKVTDWQTGEEKESDCWYDIHLTGVMNMLKTKPA